MRRTSFCVAISMTLTEAPAELTMKAMPPAEAEAATMVEAKHRENKRKRRRMAGVSPTGWRRSLRQTPVARQGYSGTGRANTAVANANITQAGVEISKLSVNARLARARNASRMIRRSEGHNRRV